MKKILMISAICLLIPQATSQCFASIPDGNVEKGKLEISGFAGSGDIVIKDEDTNVKHTTRFSWQSLEIDYGLDDNTGIGMGYWGQVYLDKPYFTADSIENIFLALSGFGLFPSEYIDYIADVHFRSQFINEKDGAAFNASWVLGLGIMQGRSILNDQSQYLLPEIGAAFSKKLFDRLSIRINLVTGVPAGAEIGLQLFDNLEVTYGNSVVNAKFIF